MSSSRIIWRSVAIFTLMQLLEVMFHEGAHAIAAVVQGGHHVVLYPGGVDPGGLVGAQYAITAAAGPLFSLVLAIVGWKVCQRTSSRGEAWLAAVWLTFHAFIGSVGYLILTPFSNNDLGGIASYFGLPPLGRWLMFGAGIWAMTKISGALLPALAATAPREALATRDDRFRFVVRAAVVPWLIGLVLAVIANLPVQNWFILAPALATGIPLVSTCFDAAKRNDLVAGDRELPAGLPWRWLAGIVVVVAVNLLVLHPGLRLS